MAEQHILRTFTGNDGEEYSMYEAQFATRGPFSWQKWYTCCECLFDFPEGDVLLKDGKAYCIPNKCYEDVI
jgi:hypothetical protein